MALTYFYAELFGTTLTLFGIAMLLNRRSMVETIRAFMDDRPLLLLSAFVGLFVGLIVVLTHNVWSAGVLAMLVTLLGWATIVKSTMILILPHGTLRRWFNTLKFEQVYYLVVFVMLVIGIYLAYAGFFVPTY